MSLQLRPQTLGSRDWPMRPMEIVRCYYNKDMEANLSLLIVTNQCSRKQEFPKILQPVNGKKKKILMKIRTTCPKICKIQSSVKKLDWRTWLVRRQAGSFWHHIQV